MADAFLNRKGVDRWRSGHPWIYRSGIDRVEEDTGAEGIARLLDYRRRVMGHAFLSRDSQITLRVLSGAYEVPDEAMFRKRLENALAWRRSFGTRPSAERLVFGESDGLPGVVVDRYENHLVVQFLSAGAESLRSVLVPLMVEVFEPESILGRNDTTVRRLEGLPLEVVQLHGSTPDTVEYHEGDLKFTANPRTGQKTGAFLDQVGNHVRVGRLARGRVYDGFSYAGGFALAAAAGGAESVVAVETSASAVAQIQANAKANRVKNLEVVDGNVFDDLRTRFQKKERFDVIVLDPPAFAKNKRELPGALRGYKEINLRAMKILAPGGILVTCSCSYQLTESLFDEVLTAGAGDARRTFRVRERPEQPHDHPIRLGFPESRYLKCRVLESLE